ncbi:hypothetical protein [Priestia megaterium]|uniref:hypothetical protein n=1 Tax=Priestia megaterium TaxID=1404 RepID=UPI0013752641|nr:hypothetical protein [Priestia megaterium]
MIIKLNNILLPLLITLGVNFLYSYIIYAFFPLLTNFKSIYWRSIKSTFIPLYLVLFVSLNVSLWILVIIPLFLISILIRKKLKLNKKYLSNIRQSKFKPIVEEWIAKQNVMRINNYSINIEIEKAQIKATVYLFVSNSLDYEEINNLEKRLPDNTIVRIKKTQKKNLGENEYLLT